MNRKSVHLALAAATVLVSLPLAAQMPATETKPAAAPDSAAAFTRLDANKDGTVDRAEAQKMPGLADALEKADKNKDGKLDKTEFVDALAAIK